MLRRLTPHLPLLIAALALAARLIPSPRTIDDAYITFRYARNLLAGQGFVYNAGERVLGTTTPLYTVLMAGLAGLTQSQAYPWLALTANALADSLTCLLLPRLAQRLTGRQAPGLAASLVWAVAPMSVTFAIGGMETSVFILLLVAAADLYLAGRERLAAAAAALLLLTRPDGLLLAGPLAADQLWRSWRARRLPWPAAAAFIGILAPWAVFATLYFGSPLPHSILAKTLAYRLPPEAGLVRLMQHYGTPFHEHLVLGNYWPLAGFALYAALYALGALGAVRRPEGSRAWPLALYPWIYFAAFSIANPLIFRWYLAPPLPLLFLFIFAGLDRLRADLPERARRSQSAVLPAAALLAAGLSLNAWVLRPDHGPARPAPDMAWHKLELLYEQVGRNLAGRIHDPAGTVVAAGDVGALGYFSGARILDTVGLMSPEATAYYPLDPALYTILYAVPPQLILDQQPEYVVLLEVYGRRGLFAEARFQAEYRLVEKLTTDIYGSDGLLVFQHREAGEP